MKAIILAAGSGTRLSKYTKDLPKCMLDFKGKTLIERQVATLRSCDITDITIIKGYLPEKINIENTKTYINKDHVNTNMVASLMLAEKELNDDVIICYGDILYEKRIIEKILASKANVGVVVDEDYWEYWELRLDNPEEDIESLIIEGDRIVEIGSEDCSIREAIYRYIGLIKFTKKGVKILKKTYFKDQEKFKKAFMTDMLQAIINQNYKIEPIIVKHGWLEFDTNQDYEKMLKLDNKKLFDIDG